MDQPEVDRAVRPSPVWRERYEDCAADLVTGTIPRHAVELTDRSVRSTATAIVDAITDPTLVRVVMAMTYMLFIFQ